VPSVHATLASACGRGKERGGLLENVGLARMSLDIWRWILNDGFVLTDELSMASS